MILFRFERMEVMKGRFSFMIMKDETSEREARKKEWWRQEDSKRRPFNVLFLFSGTKEEGKRKIKLEVKDKKQATWNQTINITEMHEHIRS